jgi:hypothetical protein
MPTTLNVRVRGLDVLYRNIDHLLAMPALADYIKEATEVGQREAQSRAPGSIQIAREIGPISGRVYAPDYRARFIEFGRKAGRKQPPASALTRYAGNDESIFLIARQIARRGIKGRFFMRRARRAVSKAMPELANKMARVLEKDWAKK